MATAPFHDARTVFTPTPQQIRGVIMDGAFGFATDCDPQIKDTTRDFLNIVRGNVAQGRMIHCTDAPGPDVYDDIATRGVEAFVAGLIPHPFSRSYVIALEGWGNDKSQGDILVKNTIIIAVAVAKHDPFDFGIMCMCVVQEPEGHKFLAVEHLSRYTYKEGKLLGENIYDSMDEGRDHASKFYYMLMFALMMLNTDGVAVERIEPSPALAKARARSGKPPIPAYLKVDSREYVTAITHRRYARPDAPKGTHASPVAHVRRGHIRTLASGVKVLVRDCLVNGKKLPPTARAYYTMSKRATE